MLAATSAKEGLSTSPAAAGGALDTASMLMSSAPALLTTASSTPRRRGDVDDDDEPERPRALAARKEPSLGSKLERILMWTHHILASHVKQKMVQSALQVML